MKLKYILKSNIIVIILIVTHIKAVKPSYYLIHYNTFDLGIIKIK